MADQDGKATGRMVRALCRAPLEPGRELRRGARFPEPSDARDRIGPVVEHEALPIAYTSTLAASTSVNPSRAARSIWRLHQTLGNRSVQRVIARARSIDGDRMRYAGIHMVPPNPDRVQSLGTVRGRGPDRCARLCRGDDRSWHHSVSRKRRRE